MEQKETILIVEDNHVLREGLCDILAFEGFNVLSAGNGQEALVQMGDSNPDLILSDISMPVMDGYEFYTSVRANPEWITIPFVFLTARGERARILCHDFGCGERAAEYLDIVDGAVERIPCNIL